MAAQFSVAVRNGWLDNTEATVGTSPKLRILTGAKPATCATAESGSLLAEITYPSDWMGAAAAGSKALAGSWTVAATNTGTAGYYRIYDSTGTTCHEQGTITVTGGGGDMTVDNTSIATGQTTTVTDKVLTAGGA